MRSGEGRKMFIYVQRVRTASHMDEEQYEACGTAIQIAECTYIPAYLSIVIGIARQEYGLK